MVVVVGEGGELLVCTAVLRGDAPLKMRASVGCTVLQREITTTLGGMVLLCSINNLQRCATCNIKCILYMHAYSHIGPADAIWAN